MAKMCSDCNYYTEENEAGQCPECGRPLQLTMLPPSGTPGAAANEPVSTEPDFTPSFEVLEQPLPVRMMQIWAGIVIFFAVSRWGSRLLVFLIGGEVDVDSTQQAAYLVSYTCFLYVMAALAGGAVAGAWSVNWIPQGVGVGLGVLIIPIILLLLVMPESLLFYMIGVAVTTALTLLGAFLGHKVVRPSQFLT